ncbi:hypothetical protein HDU89_004841 [Geranomyces variabilis]|nr:hypothetical protein HDU89_004841 [Geranomyces variabilis]
MKTRIPFEDEHFASLGPWIFIMFAIRDMFALPWAEALEQGRFALKEEAKKWPVLPQINKANAMINDEEARTTSISRFFKTVVRECGLNSEVISLKSNRKGLARAAKQFLAQDDVQGLLNHRAGTATTKTRYQGKDVTYIDIGAVHLGRAEAVLGASMDTPFHMRGGIDIPTVSKAQMGKVYAEDATLRELRSALASVEDDEEKVVIEQAIKARQKELRRTVTSETFETYHREQEDLAEDERVPATPHDTRSLQEFLSEAIAAIQDTTFRCAPCEKTYKNASSLGNHMRAVHGKKTDTSADSQAKKRKKTLE